MNTISRYIVRVSAVVICCVFTAFATQSESLKSSSSKPKTVALLGDSMTWIGGDNCEKETGWSYWLKTRHPERRITTYARSGATWTNTVATKGDTAFYSSILDDENVIYDQVRRLIGAVDKNAALKPDVIVIFAGGNDAWFQRKRPGIWNKKVVPQGSVEKLRPSDYTSLASSVELGCRLLREHFPQARILLVTPPEMSKTTPATVNRVGDTIETTGKRLGIPVLRADKGVDIRHDIEKVKPHRYTYDGVHSNPEGAKLIYQFIEKGISN